MKIREVLVHKPGLELKTVDKPGKWLFSDNLNITAMQREHDDFTRILQDEGVRIHYLLKATGKKPKLYLTRDSAVVVDKKAVTCHFIHSVRRGEEQLVKKRLKELGVKIVGHIFVPGFLHGSDLFFTDKDHAFACVGDRTNEEGIEHLEKIMNLNITQIPTGNLSNTQFNLINDIAIISEEITQEPVCNILKENGFDIIIATREQREQMGLNFIQIDDYKIVNAKSDINKKLKMLGFDVIEADIRELIKGKCGVRSMCLPFY